MKLTARLQGCCRAAGLLALMLGLYALPAGGASLGGLMTCPGTPVSNGLFTATLDFGATWFDGSPRYLDIAARTQRVR